MQVRLSGPRNRTCLLGRSLSNRGQFLWADSEAKIKLKPSPQLKPLTLLPPIQLCSNLLQQYYVKAASDSSSWWCWLPNQERHGIFYVIFFGFLFLGFFLCLNGYYHCEFILLWVGCFIADFVTSLYCWLPLLMSPFISCLVTFLALHC